MSNPTASQIDDVVRRWLRLADDHTVPAAARQALRVCAEDLTTSLQMDLPMDYSLNDVVVSSEHPSGEHGE